MSFRWTRTNAALDGFFELLACEKCKKTPERPIRFVTCGHMFCDTCCAEDTSICMKCNMPIRPNEIQPHHLVAQLLNCCRKIKEAIGEINVDDKHDRATRETELDAKKIAKFIASTDNGGKERDSESYTPGYRDPTQNLPCVERNEADLDTPGYRDPTQINRRLEANETELETPGYRDSTLLNMSIKGNEVDSETPGYRDPTQISQRGKEGNLKDKISKILSLDRKPLENSTVDAIDILREVDHVDTDILVQETFQMDGISSNLENEANIAIPESIETAEEDENHDTLSVDNLAQEWAQEFDKINKQASNNRKMFTSENCELPIAKNSVERSASKFRMDNRESTILRESRFMTEDLEVDRREFHDTVRENSEKNPNEFAMEIEQMKAENLAIFGVANAKIIETVPSKTTENSRLMFKKPKLKSVESLHQRYLPKKVRKTIVQRKSRLRDIDKPIVPKTMPKNVNKRNPKGESVLHTACIKGQDDYVKVLLEGGANPNTKDNANWTPLQEAVALGHWNICKMLLESGALPNTPGMDNRTALHEATIKNKLEEAALLLKFNANRDVYDKFGKRPIDYAVSDEMRKLLIDDSNVKKLAVFEGPCLNTALDHSILTQNAQAVVFPSNLSNNNQKLLMQIAAKFKLSVATTFRPGVTHVVVEANERNITQLTYNVMLAILEGKWILNSQWIAISTDLNDVSDIDLEIFEVHGAPNPETPERSRMNEEKQNPRLFNNCFFYFTIGVTASWTYGKLEFTKQNLTNLVLAGQGGILNREPDPEIVKDYRLTPFHVAHKPFHPLHRCSYYIIYMPGKDEPRVKYNMPHVKTLPLAWFFECIEKFELVDPILMGIS